MNILAKIILKIIGWQTVFEPLPARHGIIIVYPHTSNWDFPIGILWKFAVGMRITWIAKQEWFKPPYGWFMRALGGIGIRRDGGLHVTEQLRDTMLAQSECWLCIAPEGTRAHKDYIHMGYYHIAKSANLPIGIGFIDYKTKTVGIRAYRTAKSNEPEELAQLAIDFADIVAYDPTKVSTLNVRAQP